MFNRRVSSVVAFALAAAPVVFASQAQALPFDPKHFNVFSTGSINYVGSDFQGVAGVVGDFTVNGFSLHDIASAGPGTGVSLYAGGNVTLGGAINNGGVQAGGNVTVNSASIAGHVNAGGNLAGTGGTVSGNVALAGVKTAGPSLTVTGSLTTLTPFTPSINLNDFATYFKDASSGFGDMTPTAAAINQWGQLKVALDPGLNIVNVASGLFNSAWGFDVQGAANSLLVVNILDASVAFDSIVWSFSGGISADQVLVNLPNATTLSFSGGNHLSLLAPNANTHFSSGLLIGNLITANLTGSGQVNAGSFNGFDLGLPPPPPDDDDEVPTNDPVPGVPEPLTAGASLMALAALALTANHRRRR